MSWILRTFLDILYLSWMPITFILVVWICEAVDKKRPSRAANSKTAKGKNVRHSIARTRTERKETI